MRILIGTYHLTLFAGTEQWTRTMVVALERLGHAVDVWAFHTGPAAQGLPMVETPKRAYDALILNHRPVQIYMRQVEGVKIGVSHGPEHPLEQPIEGLDAYVGVSPEVTHKLTCRRLAARLIRNPVDASRYSALDAVDDPPHRILSLCKGLPARDIVGAACEELGFAFDFVHYAENPVLDIRPYLDAADIVVSYGRGCLEALASGRHVLVYDARPIDGRPTHRGEGWLTPESMPDISWSNCSGRRTRAPWGLAEVKEALTRMPHLVAHAGWGPRWIKQYHEAQHIAQAYVDLILELKGTRHDRNEEADREKGNAQREYRRQARLEPAH